MAIQKKIKIVLKIKITIKMKRKIMSYSNNYTINCSNINKKISYSIQKCVKLYQVQQDIINIKNNQNHSKIKMNSNRILIIKMNETVLFVDGVKGIFV